jgi:putative MATE family efflux protein
LTVRSRLLLYAFLDELGPLYALYIVFFVDHGMSATMVSLLYMFWAGMSLVAEVPSGALADRVDRRRLIAFALLLRAIGLALWILVPSTPAFFVGAALWALHSALASGTWEALVYDQLVAAGRLGAYATTMARVGQALTIGGAVGMLAAPGLLWAGLDIPALGWLTIGVHIPAALTILSLPAAEKALDDDEEESPLTFGTWLATLRTGVRTAVGTALLLRMVVLGALLDGLFIMDEYQPLLATARGAPDAAVPFYVFAIWVGLVLGGEVAARAPRLPSRWLGLQLFVAASLVAVALVSGAAAPLVLIGIGYAGQNLAWVLWEARFQERIPDGVRATVASVRSFFAMVLAMAVFGFVGLVSGDDPGIPLLVPAGLLAITGLLLAAWLPPSGKTARALPGADGEEDGGDAVEEEGLLGRDGGAPRAVEQAEHRGGHRPDEPHPRADLSKRPGAHCRHGDHGDEHGRPPAPCHHPDLGLLGQDAERQHLHGDDARQAEPGRQEAAREGVHAINVAATGAGRHYRRQVSNRDLTTGPVAGHLTRLGFPMVLGILAALSVSLVDTYFVGQLGEDPLTAISFTFPVVLTIMSLAIGLSAGASSVASRSIGRGDSEDTRRVATDSLVLAVTFVIVASGLGWWLVRPLFSFLGAKGAVLDDVVAYMEVWFFGMPFLVVPLVANGLIRANGDAVVPGAIMILVAIVNAILDPIFIRGFGPIPALGIAGAAWASLGSRGLSFALALAVLVFRERLLTLARPALPELLDSWRRILTVGVPAAASNMVNPLGVTLVTMLLASYGDEVVAAFGVATRIEAFVAIPLLALSAAIGPIAGQNWARFTHRTRQVVVQSLLFCVAWTGLATLLFAGLAESLVAPFTESAPIRRLAVQYLHVSGWTVGGYGIVIVAAAACNAIGEATRGLAMNLFRTAVLTLPLVALAVQLGPASDPFWAFAGIAVANVVSSAVAAAWVVAIAGRAEAH